MSDAALYQLSFRPVSDKIPATTINKWHYYGGEQLNHSILGFQVARLIVLIAEVLFILQSERVWVKPIQTKDASDELPFAAKILRQDKDNSLVVNDDDEELWINNSQV